MSAINRLVNWTSSKDLVYSDSTGTTQIVTLQIPGSETFEGYMIVQYYILIRDTIAHTLCKFAVSQSKSL